MLTAEYRKFLPRINNNYDFAELLSEYLDELNVSHTVSGYRVPSSRESASTANLGVFFDLGWDGDGLKVAEIVKGGPFDKASSKLTREVIYSILNIAWVHDNDISCTHALIFSVMFQFCITVGT